MTENDKHTNSRTAELGPPSADLASRTPEHQIDPPPIMKTWRRLYALVLGVLAADILIFWIVTRVFS